MSYLVLVFLLLTLSSQMSARIRCGKNAIVDGKVAFLLLFDDSRVLVFTIKLFVLPERSVNKFCCIHFTSIKSYVTLMIRGICSKLTTKTLDLRQWTLSWCLCS